MPMERIAEPELMDAEDQAAAYANADFSAPHDAFVELFRAHFGDSTTHVLDLGCGPADVTIRFARAFPRCEITGLDGAEAMLTHAMRALEREGLTHRVRLKRAYLPVELPTHERYGTIISNSLLHHLRDPLDLWRMVRCVAAPRGQIFVMDLMRPSDYNACRALLDQYASDAPAVLGRDFYHSLRAAYTVAEVREQLDIVGLSALRVEAVSDRHWIAHGHCV